MYPTKVDQEEVVQEEVDRGEVDPETTQNTVQTEKNMNVSTEKETDKTVELEEMT